MARPSWLYDEDTLKDVLPVGVLVLLLGLRVLGLCCCASTSSRARARRRVHLVIVSLVLGLGCAAAALCWKLRLARWSGRPLLVPSLPLRRGVPCGPSLRS